MTDRVGKFARVLIWGLPVWALMLLLGTLTHQPDPQTQFGAWSEYVTTQVFLLSHLVNSILGASIGSLGFIGLMLYLSDTRASGRATVAMIAVVVGNTLTAAVFGAAAFVQPALGRAFLAGDTGAQDMYNAVYGAPLFITVGIGLLLFIGGVVLAGIAVAASRTLPRWAGWLLALAVPIFAVANNILPAVVQAPAAAAMLVATLAIAWAGTREPRSGFAVTPAAHA